METFVLMPPMMFQPYPSTMTSKTPHSVNTTNYPMSNNKHLTVQSPATIVVPRQRNAGSLSKYKIKHTNFNLEKYTVGHTCLFTVSSDL